MLRSVVLSLMLVAALVGGALLLVGRQGLAPGHGWINSRPAREYRRLGMAAPAAASASNSTAADLKATVPANMTAVDPPPGMAGSLEATFATNRTAVDLPAGMADGLHATSRVASQGKAGDPVVAAAVITVLVEILKKPMETVIDEIRASRGAMPAEYVETFNFHNLQVGEWRRYSFPDNDEIYVMARRDDTLPPDSVGFELECSNDWWKAITIHKGNSYQFEVAHVQDNPHSVSRGTLRVTDFYYNIVLSKAKMFGIHTNMYMLYDAENMLVGHTYRFYWYRD